MVTLQKRARGRPTIHPIDRIRTQVWFSAVKHASGLRSAYAIEMKLDGDKVRKRDTDVARPRKWDGYAKGKAVPKDKPGVRNAIDQAESAFPGTAKWFRSPMWDVLKGKKFNQFEIEALLFSLDPRIVSMLFGKTSSAGGSAPRMLPFHAGSARLLHYLPIFDSLVTIVLIASLAEAISSVELRNLAVKTYGTLSGKVREIPELRDVSPKSWSLIDAHFKHWTFLSLSQRMDIVFFPPRD
ncbi:hypothetical protein NUK34_04010 [Kerstersia gyiorum]|uniref:hypothetical protein n=1 Tax=Kerstersia gyiorum TaxID=206506 RepID=UPI00215064C0|nr:hypothetical protein [Kerstersia gyiorum]MCR4158019.1 hypothetical protein [Kerstersia gyiorum]